MEEPRFIFDWSRGPKWEGDWRLLFLIFVSLVGHVVVFYLFQVSYPRTERWAPRTRGVMLLSSVDPISAQVLRELDDRTFHLQGAGGSEVPAYALTKMAPKFRPSFVGHEVALRPKPAPEQEERLPMLLPAGEPEFPEVSAREPVGSAPASVEPQSFGAVSVRASLDGVSEAGAPRPQILPELQREIVNAAGTWRRLRLRVAVGADGGIVNLLTESVDEGTISPRWLEKVRQGIRFQPGADRRWGWLEVRR
jgi:hypothetical protein